MRLGGERRGEETAAHGAKEHATLRGPETSALSHRRFEDLGHQPLRVLLFVLVRKVLRLINAQCQRRSVPTTLDRRQR